MKFKFEKNVNIKFLNEVFGDDFEGDIFGEGIYKFVVGSRGEVENIEKVSDDNILNYKNKEELMEDLKGEEESEELMEYLNEFVGSEIEEFCVVEYLGEEIRNEYYWVREI